MIFLTDKTFDGVCAALFYAFTRKVFPSAVLDISVPFMPQIGEEVTTVSASKDEINRVKRALWNCGGDDIIYQVSVVLSSCKEECLTAAFFYLKRTLELKRNLFYAYGEKCVTEFFYISDTVMNEKHRINGFLRFKETKKGVMYACFSPDNDILWLISPHFLSRLNKIPFVIHDLKRSKIALSDGKKVRYLKVDKEANLDLTDREKELEAMWKKYYEAVNIIERKNLRQQNRCMPKKYRKFMPETFEI